MSLEIAGDARRFLRPRGIRILIRGSRLLARVLFTRFPEDVLFPKAQDVVDLILAIRDRVRSYGAEHLRDVESAVFACNHIGIFDPVYLIHEVFRATDGRLRCAQLMRDDFFKISWINRRMAMSCNTIPFTRGGLTPGSMGAFLKKVREYLDCGVIIFISGTRSRSGEVMDAFRGERRRTGAGVRKKERGRILHALLRRIDTEVSLVPTTLTYDFATRDIRVVFGRPIRHQGTEGPQAVRRTVRRVVSEVENQVYIGAQHLLSCLLHGPGLESQPTALPMAAVRSSLRRAVETLIRDYPYVEEELREDLDGTVSRTLDWYRRKGAIRIQNGTLRLARDLDALVLSPNARLRHVLPSLFYWNQVKHIRPLRESVQAALQSQGLL